jgi:hypothetical protein
LIAGGSPAAGIFLLLRQKKGTKEKATPFHRPFGVPCVARQAGRLRYSAAEKGNPKINFNALSGQSPDRPKTLPRALRVTARSENPFCAASVCPSNWDEGDNTVNQRAKLTRKPG